MTLQKIAETLTTTDSYEDAYRRHMQDKIWLEELLLEGYQELCEHTISEQNTAIDYMTACTVMDKVVLNVVMIYDEYLRQLERNFNEVTTTSPTDPAA